MADKYVNEVGVAAIRTWADNKFATGSDLNSLSTRVDNIVSQGGEPNVITEVKQNGTALTITNKAVNVTVPTKVSDLTNDGDGTTGSAFATESYVDTNGGKIDSIKVNGSTQTITNKVVDIAVPTKTSDLTNDSNFAVDSSYVHTDNNFTTTLKNKLNGIAAGAEVNVQADWNITDSTSDAYILHKPSIPSKTSDLTNDSNFVSDASYVHTDNNLTSTLLSKLNGIAAGAEVNVQPDWNQGTSTADDYIKNKPTNVSQFTNDAGYQTATQVSNAISAAVASAYIYKGSVATVNDLPATGNTAGDVYDVQATGVNYAWTGTAWDALGSYVDTSLYWAKSELVAMTTAEVNAILTA